MRLWSNLWPVFFAGLEETNIQPGDNVAVMGLGPIGSMFVRMAKVYGRARDRDRPPAEPVGTCRTDGCR